LSTIRLEEQSAVVKIEKSNLVGKTKSKSRSELEYLRAENRRLKKENRHLKRQNHLNEEIVEDLIEDVEVESCEECGKGVVEKLDLGKVEISTCRTCGHREVKRSGKKEETKKS
jgi:hypothetical protein